MTRRFRFVLAALAVAFAASCHASCGESASGDPASASAEPSATTGGDLPIGARRRVMMPAIRRAAPPRSPVSAAPQPSP